jgi:hypothetical protein
MDRHVTASVPGLSALESRQSTQASVADSGAVNDFDRLSHISGFRMTEVRVDVRGDEAVMEYGIQGTLDSGAQRKMPSGGELHFRRGPKGWEMTSHRLKE